MKKPFYLLILVCLFFINFSAQTPQTLTLSQTIEHEINGGETHLFSFRTEANKTIQIMLFQQGIDVYTVALNSEKKKIAEVDSQNGRNGPEKLEFVVESSGEYFIEVRTGKGVPSGKFKITLTEIRNATEDDRARMQANNIFCYNNYFQQSGM
ncbi:MAG TPA: PPC domain-containing protein, partial [Pyrinomonadaceae bacterium]|nr:PPC domain-containing protein [Pyrinomonadaceae bacterium]